MSKFIRAEIIVNGLVQGVGFRYFVLRQAMGLHVTGYVRNLYTGEVQTIIEGETFEVKELIEYIKVGPFGAHVNKFTIDWSEATAEFTQFEIRH